MNLSIKRASNADAALLASLSKKTFVDAFGDTCSKDDMNNFVETHYSEEQLYKELSDPLDYYFIAFMEGTPAAYMRLKEDYTDYPDIERTKALELKRIYVLDTFQSKKAGSRLIDFAIQFAIELHYEMIWLGVWEFNHKAIRFYQNKGFSDSGFTHPFYIGNTKSTDKWFIKMLKEKADQ